MVGASARWADRRLSPPQSRHQVNARVGVRDEPFALDQLSRKLLRQVHAATVRSDCDSQVSQVPRFQIVLHLARWPNSPSVTTQTGITF